MPVGDTVVNTSSIASGARLTFQPASGTVYMVYDCKSGNWVGVSPDQAPNIVGELYDGANYTEFFRGDNNPAFMNRLKVFINNSIYLSIYNLDAAARYLGYGAIRIK